MNVCESRGINMYDVVIVGGGPSGATLARLLNRDLRVLIIEKRDLGQDYNKGFTKCCGGLLAPDAQKVLAQLGLGVPKEVLVGPQLFTVKTIDYDNIINRYYQRHYININREKFDRWLFSLIPAKVTRSHKSILKDIEEEDNGDLRVTYTCNGELKKVKTHHLVGADGGFSKVRKHIDPHCSIKKYASIQEWYEVNEAMPYFTTIFDQRITDFYSWTIPKENMLIIGSAIPYRDHVNEKFNLLKEKLRKEGFPLTKCVKREGSFIIRPERLNAIQTGKKNIFLIGEAAGFISPSSAEGFSYAMRSGAYLADVMNKDIQNCTPNQYRIKCRKLYQNIRIKNAKSIVMYQPLIRKMVMKAGILSMKVRRK